MKYNFMIKKAPLLLLITFSMAINFCFAQSTPITAPIKNAVVPLELTSQGLHLTLSGKTSRISLQKSQELIIHINIKNISQYQLIYEEPSFIDDFHPLIYYTLSNPYSSIGWSEWFYQLPVLQEERSLNTVSNNSVSLHFMASDAGTKEITVNVFDDTGKVRVNPTFSQKFGTVASFTITVTVK